MSKYKKLFLLALLVVTAFSVGYGAVAEAWPVFGRNANRGYFLNNYDNDGDYVWRPYVWPNSNPTAGCSGDGVNAIPNSINTKSEFIAFVKCKLNSTADNSHVRKQDRTGAAFIIQTMRGLTGTEAGCALTNCRPSDAQIADWEARINNAQVTMTSTTRSYTVNSYYQGNPIDGNSSPNDNAFYSDSGTQSAIVFSAGTTASTYVIRRPCANPISTGSLPEPQSFNMTGNTTISATEVLPGDTLTFRHYVRNVGPDDTSPTSINYSVRDTVNNTISLSGSAGTFAAGEQKIVRVHNVVVPADAAPGSQICRRVEWNPDTQNGGSGVGTPRCATVLYDFDLEPRINVVIRDASGADVTSEGVAEPGYTIEFTYSVNNSGLTESQTVTCTYNQAANAGYNTADPTQVFTPSGANCGSRTFPRNATTQTAVESVSGAAVVSNTTICRSLTVAPATQDGGSAMAKSCIPVVAKPYSRVYGGDVAVGSGFGDLTGSSCVVNNNAAIVGWNRRGTGSNNWAGAGTEYAAYAMAVINDFASALGPSSGGGRAPAPNGLTFANTGVGQTTTNGLFGGYFESAPCMPDYYGARPASASVLGTGSVNPSNMSSGTYFRDGDLRLDNSAGGADMTITAGKEITIYVNGNVHITDSVNYTGSWTITDMPMFRVIANGNIYMDNDSDDLDGFYVAQGDSSSSGIFFACAETEPYSADPPFDANLNAVCSNNLRVDGAIVAREIRTNRTRGTLSQANRSDAPPNPAAAAEVFNYTPEMWIKQPADTTGNAGEYDSIISLPPIL